MSFSELLKQCRKKQGVSQAELASRLGVTQQAVGKWESGKSSPDPSTVARVFAEEGAAWLAVSCLTEALQLRNAGRTLPILILYECGCLFIL